MTQADGQHPNDRQNECGFRLFNLEQADFPILVSVPHSGREYPAGILENLRIPPHELLRLEDRYADRLIAPALAQGMPAIIANRARAWIDLNRSVEELDPAMVSGWDDSPRPAGSAKMRGGLGLVPRRLMQSGDIWKRPFGISDIRQRIETYHSPYHESISAQLARLRDRFGVALLVDIHSMPPLVPVAGHRPHIVIGDRFGQSAASIYSEMLIERLKQSGMPVALNHPYPGDYILRRHADVRRNIHAIQIEIDRTLYLDSDLREPSAGLESTAAILSEMLALLVDLLGGTAMPNFVL